MKNLRSLILCCTLALMLAGCAERGAGAEAVGGQASNVQAVAEAEMATQSGDPLAEPQTVPSGEDPANGAAPDTMREEAAGPALPANSEAPAAAGDGAGDSEIDVDLTVLSSTMVYSEVYQMMVSPEEYVGKTVKMRGIFDYYHDPSTDANYFMCLIQDATACCAQGMEFILTEDYSYPEDYPEAGQEICVVGVFDTYLENQNLYCTLRNAKRLE